MLMQLKFLITLGMGMEKRRNLKNVLRKKKDLVKFKTYYKCF